MRHEKPSQFRVEVNDSSFIFNSSSPAGREILATAGFVPAEEHVLIQLLSKGTRSVGLDESVDLRGEGAEAFWAFRGDRIFVFTVNKRGFEWGTATISEPELRRIADVDDDEIIILQREGEDRELGPDDEVVLSESGTEQLHTAKRLITVYLDGTEKHIPSGTHTTEELIQVLGVAPGYLLNMLSHEGQLVTLQPGQKVRVKEEMKFFSQVPCGGSS